MGRIERFREECHDLESVGVARPSLVTNLSPLQRQKYARARQSITDHDRIARALRSGLVLILAREQYLKK